MQSNLLLKGRMLQGKGDDVAVVNRADGTEITAVAEAAPGQVDAAVTGASAAFETFSCTPPAERAALLLAIVAGLEAHQQELAELESLDCGKPWRSTSDVEIAKGEVFGPVVTILRYSDAENALNWVDATRHDLVSSVWTRDVGLAMAVTSRMRYGFTWVNPHGASTCEMPWAVMKGAGTGCDMPVHAFDAHTSIRHATVAHG